MSLTRSEQPFVRFLLFNPVDYPLLKKIVRLYKEVAFSRAEQQFNLRYLRNHTFTGSFLHSNIRGDGRADRPADRNGLLENLWDEDMRQVRLSRRGETVLQGICQDVLGVLQLI